MSARRKITWLVATLSAAALGLGAAAAIGGGRSPAQPSGLGAGTPLVQVKLVEFKLLPVPKRAPATAGKVSFVVRNAGKIAHEFVVLKTDTPAGKLPLKSGKAVETVKVGKIAALKPGQTKTLTLGLKPGHYALICNLPGHYKSGQFADFTVGAASTSPTVPTTSTPQTTTPQTTTSATPALDPAQVRAGEELFQSTAAGIGCARCHGVDARGGIGPNVVGKSPAAIKQAIGIVAQMAAFQDLTDNQIQAISTYLKSLTK